MLNTTKIVLVWELAEQGIPKMHIAEKLEVNRDMARLLVAGIERVGLVTFLDTYTNAKKGSHPGRQVYAILKRRSWMIRDR